MPRRSGARTNAARCSPIPASPRSTRRAFPVSGDYQSKLTLMSRVAAQRRPRLGAAQEGRQAPAQPDPRSRARLLPGAPLSELRQPRAARRRLAQRQSGLRRRPRRRRERAGGVPRFPRRHPAARQERHQGALRQPVRHVRAHHGRRPLLGPDAHLPRHPLHHGRAVGGLQPDVDDSRPVRDRRGELLRPRRQPARRQRADAGARRRLLRPAEHDRRLHCVATNWRRWMATTRRCARPNRRSTA